MNQLSVSRHVAIIPYAGLGNRIRAIASGIYIAKKLKATSTIYWNVTRNCFASFHDLFQPININNVSLVENHSVFHKIPTIRNLYVPRLFQEIIYDQCIFNFNKNKDGDIFGTIGNNRKLLLVSYHSMAAHYDLKEIFCPADDINSNIQSIVNQFTANTIGIHVRRTDNFNSIQLSSDDSFIRKIDKEIGLNPDVNFYLATDDLSVKEGFVKRYGDKIITVYNRTNRNTIEGMKFAVQELFTLSRTKKIIGSAYSSYSEIAAELGHIQLDIAL